MSDKMDHWYVRGVVLFAAALALGFATVITISALGGRTGQLFADDLAATLCMLAAFVIVGVVAGVAARLGGVVGSCALLGGIVVVATLHFLGYVGEQQGLQNQAWTGAALAKGLLILLSLPAALVGSGIGVGVGIVIKRRNGVPAKADEDTI